MLNEATVWVAAILAALILIPVIGYSVRKRDFRRQVQGKRKERKANGGNPSLYPDRKEQQDYYKETLKNEAWQRSKQNFFVPK